MLDLDSDILSIFTIISEVGEELNQPVYCVGGFVRDYFLSRINTQKSTDIDFVTIGSGIDLAEKVHERLSESAISVYKTFGTAHVTFKQHSLEFIGARKESYSRDSRKPAVENGSLRDDQLRRDFTINSLYWSLNKENYGSLIDPFNGVQDLRHRIIRTPVDPDQTFSDDPLRMLRAVRFASQLDFDIHPETLAGIERNAHRLEIISKERIIDEVNKIVASPVPSVGFGLMFNTKLLHQFFPELCDLQGVEEVFNLSHKDNFWHTLQVLDNVARVSENLWLRWAAIMHDIAKTPTKRFDPVVGWTFHGHDAVGAKWVPKIFRRLMLPLDDRMKFVAKLVRLHLRPIALVKEEVSDSAIRRLIFEAGDDIEALMTLCRADITSKNDKKVKRYLSNFSHVEKRIKEVEEKDHVRNWQPPVDGQEIMDVFNLKPGREIGVLKEAVKEAVLNGDIENNHEVALQFLKDNASSILEKANL